ncbi:MAG: hypothetical protein CMH12_08755 [Maritimibacter sp.]|nr:hypothetical protein [Maritimibacter sp.]
MTQPFGIAVIGAGMAATPHARALAELSPDIAVRGVWTRGDSGAAMAAEYGFPLADSPEALAADPSVDALLLLTPPDARIDPVRLFAGAGKHVLSEKPIGRTLAEAEEVAAICADAGVQLGVVFQHRYRAGSVALQRMLRDGELGTLQMARADIPWWRDQGYYDAPGRGTMARDGGGVLISQAIHTLDLMLSLTGPVRTVQGLAATTGLHDMECEDFATAGLRFENGAVGSVFATTAAWPGGAESIRLDCSKCVATLQSGTLRIDWRDGRTETVGEEAATGGGADPMAFPHDWHRDLIAGFVDAARAGRAPEPSGQDALAAQGLIDAILRSSDTGRAIQLGDS